MKKRFSVVALLLSVNSYAAGYGLLSPEAYQAFDVIAPVVTSTAAVSDLRVGMIVYDAGTDQYKGLNVDGVWQAFSSPGGDDVRTAYASFGGGSEPDACDSNPCTLWRDNGVSSVMYSTTGDYTITFDNGFFSETPTCSASARVPTGSSGALVNIGATSSTSAHVSAISPNSGTAINPGKGVDITCVGR